MKPIVAVVGRPNVGKSTLVNRLAQTSDAIVHESRGVTRDRSYHEADWNGVEFMLIDTGVLTDIVGITGIAGPDGGTAEKPVGLIYIALSDGERTWVTKRSPIGRTKSREWHRHCAASQALDMVRRSLDGLPVIAE